MWQVSQMSTADVRVYIIRPRIIVLLHLSDLRIDRKFSSSSALITRWILRPNSICPPWRNSQQIIYKYMISGSSTTSNDQWLRTHFNQKFISLFLPQKYRLRNVRFTCFNPEFLPSKGSKNVSQLCLNLESILYFF